MTVRATFAPLSARWRQLTAGRAGPALCFALGAVASLAQAPLGLVPVLFATLPLLYLALAEQSPWRAAARAYCYSLGTLVFSLYWIAASMTVDLAAFWWAIPFAVLGLPAYLSIYAGAAGWIFGRWQLRRGPLPLASGVPLLAALLTLAEFARGYILTGFPWAQPGNAWAWLLPLRQSLSLFGLYGLTLLTLLVALTPLLWLARARRARVLAGAITLLALALTGWGAWRLSAPALPLVDGVRLRLVQPAIPQSLKTAPTARAHNFETALALAATPSPAKPIAPTIIIWPESAVPYILQQDEDARLAIAARTPTGGYTLVGAVSRTFEGDGTKHYYNGLSAVSDVGAMQWRYDKHHLVPFGEFFPWRQVFRAAGLNISAIAAGENDFTAGPGPATLHLTGVPPVGPLICYEAIFSHEAVDEADRPQWLLNITNDAWFGDTAGPYQHFELARDRAIEEGLPLARAANTGLSGVIDPYGRVLARTVLDERLALDTGLPQALPATLFAQYGHTPALLGILGCLMLAWAYRKPE